MTNKNDTDPFWLVRLAAAHDHEINATLKATNCVDMLSNLIFYAESVVHFALNNNVSIESDWVDAICYMRSRATNSKFFRNDVERALKESAQRIYVDRGGSVAMERGDKEAIISNMIVDMMKFCNHYRYIRPADCRYTYCRFLEQYAYLVVAKPTARSIMARHSHADTVC